MKLLSFIIILFLNLPLLAIAADSSSLSIPSTTPQKYRAYTETRNWSTTCRTLGNTGVANASAAMPGWPPYAPTSTWTYACPQGYVAMQGAVQTTVQNTTLGSSGVYALRTVYVDAAISCCPVYYVWTNSSTSDVTPFTNPPPP